VCMCVEQVKVEKVEAKVLAQKRETETAREAMRLALADAEKAFEKARCVRVHVCVRAWCLCVCVCVCT
jgi:hypothetical protein